MFELGRQGSISTGLVLGVIVMVLVVTAFVYLFVDGYPPSHPLDLFVWWLHRLHAWLFAEGLIAVTPALWRPGRKPSPLSDYQPEASR